MRFKCWRPAGFCQFYFSRPTQFAGSERDASVSTQCASTVALLVYNSETHTRTHGHKIHLWAAVVVVVVVVVSSLLARGARVRENSKNMRMNDLLRRLSSPGLSKQQYLSNLNDFSRLCRANKSDQLFQLTEEQSGSECSTTTTTSAPRVPANDSQESARPRRQQQQNHHRHRHQQQHNQQQLHQDEDDEDEEELADRDTKSSLPALDDIFCW